VDGVLELLLIDKEADGFAVLLVGQGGVGVAGQAVCIFGLVLGTSKAGPGKKKQNYCRKNDMERKKAQVFHAPRRYSGPVFRL